MDKKVAVIFRGNYADEFDYVAGQIVSESDVIRDVNDPRLQGVDLDREREIYFGTNEYVTVTVRELITGSVIIPLETETEIKLAKYLERPFGRVLDIVEQAISEVEDKKIRGRNLERWRGFTSQETARLRELWSQPPNSGHWISDYRDEWRRLGLEGETESPYEMDSGLLQ